MTCGVVVLLIIMSASALAQREPRAVPLPAPNAELDAEFTRVAGVRELSDGRVLVIDAAEKRLVVVDWAAGSARQLGREGQGPGEYTSLNRLLPLADDSTLLVDALAGRWLLLHRDSIVATVAAESPAIRGGARSPFGADTSGYVYASQLYGPNVSRGGLPTRVDSALLVRVSRGNGTVDTLAVTASAPSRINTNGTPGRAGFSVEIVRNPMAVGDQVAVFPDGWVAIARVDPYRMDWVRPNGEMVRGAALPFARHAVNEREQRAILRREADRTGRPERDPASVLDWPESLPPFLGGSLVAAPDGRLWIRRYTRADDQRTTYDIVDRRGVLVARLTMMPNEHLAGIGRASLYTVLTDDDGLQWLRRHPLPRF